MNALQDLIVKHNRRGWAVGRSDIKTDSIDFVYRKEKFNFPATQVAPLCKSDGSFYLAKIKTLRKLAKNGDHA